MNPTKRDKTATSARSALIWGSLAMSLAIMGLIVLLASPQPEYFDTPTLVQKLPTPSQQRHSSLSLPTSSVPMGSADDHGLTPELSQTQVAPMPQASPEQAESPAEPIETTGAFVSGRTDLAVAEAQLALHETGSTLQALDEIGTAMHVKGDDNQAIIAYETALATTNANGHEENRLLSIQMRLITLYIRNGLRDKAIAETEAFASRIAGESDSPYTAVLQQFQMRLAQN